jgi:hypothetical protein
VLVCLSGAVWGQNTGRHAPMKSSHDTATIEANTAPADGSWQGTTELQKGIARAVTKPADLQQGYWVVFHDSVTNAEIWQLDGDESPGMTQIPGILNRTPWNGDGSRFVLTSSRCVPGLYCGDVHNFVYSADGSVSRPIRPYDPTRQPAWKQSIPVSGYTPWDRFNSNVIYWATGNDMAQGFYATPQSSLYAIDLSAEDKATKVVDLPNPARRKAMQSYPSEDNILMVQDVNPPVETSDAAPEYVVNLSMVDLNAKQLLYSYPISFGLTATGHSQSEEYHIHDIYFRRDATDRYIFNYGPRSDVGEAVFFEMPLNGDVSKSKLSYADPGTMTPYYSHPAWNSDGSLVAYSGESALNDNQWAVWVRNHDQQRTLSKVGAAANHIGWDGYDPYYLVFDGWTSKTSYDLVRAAPDGSWSGVLVKYPPRTQTDPGIGMLIGPAQSPDATKVMFSIPLQFVGGAPLKTFVAVDHRPIAPQLKVVATAPVELQWTPYVAHREVKGYRVYRSRRPESGYSEISNGLVAGTTFQDRTAKSGLIFYYAVTAEENSGLESDTPSVVKVTVGGPENASTWNARSRLSNSPAPPTQLLRSKLSPGVWALHWKPSSSKNVRYYNLYYSSAAFPMAQSSNQVASIPSSQSSFTYWMASPDPKAWFAVVSVDRQGRISKPAYAH